MPDFPVLPTPGAAPVTPYSVNTTGGGTTKKIKTPEYLAAQKKEEEANNLQLGALDQQRELDIEKQGIEKQQALESLDNANAAELERKFLADEIQKKITAHETERQKAVAEREAASKITDYWEDKSVPAKVIAAIAQGFGAYASSINGGPNYAYEILKDAQQADRQRKELRLQNAVKKLEQSGVDYGRILEFEKAARERIDHEQTAGENALMKKADALKKALPQAQASADAFKAKTLQNQAQDTQRRESEFAKQVSSTHSNQSIEGQKQGSSESLRGVVYGKNGEPVGVVPNDSGPGSADRAIKRQEHVSSWMTLDSILGKLEQSYKDYGREFNGVTSESGNREVLIKNAAALIAVMNGQGAMTKDEAKEALSALGGGYGWTTIGDPVGKIAAQRGVARDKLESALSAAGLKGKDIANKLTGQPGAAPEATTPATAPASNYDVSKLSAKDAAALMREIQKNPNHPLASTAAELVRQKAAAEKKAKNGR